MTETLDKDCTVCGKSIEITAFDSGLYTGGHYFGTLPSSDVEYWECNDCFHENSA